MAVQKNFFYDYFDGQIIKEDSDKYKMFKLLLTSIVSVFALFCAIAGFCSFAVFLLVEFGMVWNFYIKIDSKISIFFCVIVASIYFAIACYYKLFANAVIYIGFYIPFQLFATTKTYYGGSFVQIRKEMTDIYQVIYIVASVFLSVMLYMLSIGVGGRFAILDAVSAGLLVSSALLRNERYNDYYYYRAIALILSIILWVLASLEYKQFELIVVAVMYLSYLVFDVVTNAYQKNTYENEYMQICKKHYEIENQPVIEKKLKVYKKSK